MTTVPNPSLCECGCGGQVNPGRTWIQYHHLRPSTLQQVAERLLLNVTVDEDGCWLSNRKPIPTGYVSVGVTWRDDIQTTGSHRAVYEWINGPIPDGIEIDHACHNRDVSCVGPCKHRRCVRPDHLEAVTPSENKRRGRTVNAKNAQKTHCIRGHELSGDNILPSTNGRRRCRQCARDRHEERWATDPDYREGILSNSRKFGAKRRQKRREAKAELPPSE
jgi:hypothetical protein